MAEVFVGRTSERHTLAEAFDRAIAGRGSVILLSGEAGIGKTTLAARAADDAEARGLSAHWGHCWDSGMPSFWPWLRIARSISQLSGAPQPVVDAAAELESELSTSSNNPWEANNEARFATFDRCGRALRRIAETNPTLLLFDDLHASDPASLALLAFVARELPDSRIAIIATVREPDDQLDERRRRLLTDLGRWSRNLRLAAFTPAEAGELVSCRYRRETSPKLLGRLYSLSEGNPLYIDEFARLLDARQALSEADPEIEIPHAVGSILDQRLALLMPETRSALATAAAIGRDFSLSRLSLVTGRTPDDLAPLLGEAEHLHVIHRAKRTDEYQFSHGLLADALYRTLSPSARTAVHAHLAEQLRKHESSEGERNLPELAYHLSRAGILHAGEAIEFATRAGEAEMAAHAYENAIEHFRAAIAKLSEIHSSDPEKEVTLLTHLGECHARLMESAEAREALNSAIRIARRRGLPRLLARAAWIFGTLDMGVPRGNVDAELVDLLEDAIARLGAGDPKLRVRLLSRLAMELHYGSPAERRVALCDEAERLAITTSDPATIGLALSNRHFALWDTIALADLMRLAERTLEAARQSNDLDLELQARTWVTLDSMQLGDLSRIEREIALYAERANELRQPRYIGLAALVRAVRALWRGDFDSVDSFAQQALAVGERIGQPEMFRNAILLTALSRREQGRLAEVDAVAQMAAARAPGSAISLCVLGLAAAEHDDGLALDDVLRSGRRLRGSADERGWRAWLVAGLAYACLRRSDSDTARWLYDMTASDAGSHIVLGPNGYLGPYDHHLGLLAEALGDFERATGYYEKSIAMSRESQGRPWLARSLFAYAEFLRSQGGGTARRKAREMLEECVGIAEAVGMASVAAAAATALREHGMMPPAPVAAGEPAANRGLFRREGDVWTIAFSGRVGRVKDRKGMRYLAELLRQPGREIHVIELVALTDSLPSEGAKQAEALHDEIGTAKRSGGVRLASPIGESEQRLLLALAERLSIANETGDREGAATIEAEMYRMAEHAQHGQTRTFDVIRTNVSRALKSAIDKIGAENPDLKLYLAATIRKGQYCSYQPDRRVSVRWEF